MIPAALLVTKEREIAEELEDWVTAGQMLSKGETVEVSVTIKVKKTPIVKVKIEPGGRKKPLRPDNPNLTEEDWNLISSFNWNTGEAAIIGTLRERKNRPVSRDDVEQKFPRLAKLTCTKCTTMNMRFSRGGYPFRIRRLPHGEPRSEREFQMFK